MGPILTVAVVAVVAALSWRALRREYSKAMTSLKDAESTLSKRTPDTLVRDPTTGVYRPSKRED